MQYVFLPQNASESRLVSLSERDKQGTPQEHIFPIWRGGLQKLLLNQEGLQSAARISSAAVVLMGRGTASKQAG